MKLHYDCKILQNAIIMIHKRFSAWPYNFRMNHSLLKYPLQGKFSDILFHTHFNQCKHGIILKMQQNLMGNKLNNDKGRLINYQYKPHVSPYKIALVQEIKKLKKHGSKTPVGGI